mmetsp:Transcript_16451/g.45389  ORF Transcript_16451/g.45389 Transcript_16451/m.45389 type:complete len:246 (+) Transcript_16451:705-1442(+)
MMLSSSGAPFLTSICFRRIVSLMSGRGIDPSTSCTVETGMGAVSEDSSMDCGGAASIPPEAPTPAPAAPPKEKLATSLMSATLISSSSISSEPPIAASASENDSLWLATGGGSSTSTALDSGPFFRFRRRFFFPPSPEDFAAASCVLLLLLLLLLLPKRIVAVPCPWFVVETDDIRDCACARDTMVDDGAKDCTPTTPNPRRSRSTWLSFFESTTIFLFNQYRTSCCRQQPIFFLPLRSIEKSVG